MSSLPTETGGILAMNGIKLDIQITGEGENKASTRGVQVAENGVFDLTGIDPRTAHPRWCSVR